MGEHKLKEKAEKDRQAFKEKIKQRLFADDVTLTDFFEIDSGDTILIRPSNNDVTFKIWQDIINMNADYGCDNGESAIREVFEDIGDIVASALLTYAVPYDTRYISEISNEEHVTLPTATIYKFITNIGLSCTEAAEFSLYFYYWKRQIENGDTSITDKQRRIVAFVVRTLEDYDVKEGGSFEGAILSSVANILNNQFGKIKLKELVNE